MDLELELGVVGRGKTRKEAMDDAEKRALRLSETKYAGYDLITYGTRNIFIGQEPDIEVIRDVKFVKEERILD